MFNLQIAITFSMQLTSDNFDNKFHCSLIIAISTAIATVKRVRILEFMNN